MDLILYRSSYLKKKLIGIQFSLHYILCIIIITREKSQVAYQVSQPSRIVILKQARTLHKCHHNVYEEYTILNFNIDDHS